ncbi:MarR family winged helix-turn-helix transcriptional regulator [Pararoseomonas indoligenes]|uniref:MarR family transcriptional regulator n=1 Tax=Roseomonas indoligenes TaxID=2820811 RepID=A0A940N2C4_9PROT|nr:MarR family transcriptional regulator [Pararoseomonas indoligenes]MBP0493925.1 MarR family transcriptional regulator [Pararoseomonas indoligenes]
MHTSPRATLPTLIASTARHWRRAVDRRLEPFGLSEATWLPLIRLARAPAPMRQKELALSLSLDGSSVVRLLDSLEGAGLVERRGEGTDRRAKAIVLTEAGRSLASRVEEVSAAMRDEALAGLTEEEIAAAHRVMTQIMAWLADPEVQAA